MKLLLLEDMFYSIFFPLNYSNCDNIYASSNGWNLSFVKTALTSAALGETLGFKRCRSFINDEKTDKSWTLTKLTMQINKAFRRPIWTNSTQNLIHLPWNEILQQIIHIQETFGQSGHWKIKFWYDLITFHYFCLIGLVWLSLFLRLGHCSGQENRKNSERKKMLGGINITGVKTLSEVLARSVSITYSVAQVHKY